MYTLQSVANEESHRVLELLTVQNQLKRVAKVKRNVSESSSARITLARKKNEFSKIKTFSLETHNGVVLYINSGRRRP